MYWGRLQRWWGGGWGGSEDGTAEKTGAVYVLVTSILTQTAMADNTWNT